LLLEDKFLLTLDDKLRNVTARDDKKGRTSELRNSHMNLP
jgi:hypothetical protein